MSTPDAAGYISNAGRTEAEVQASLEKLVALDKEFLGGSAEAELTVSGGAVTPVTGVIKVRGEGGVDDDLATIAQTNHPDGRLLLVRASNPGAEDITLKHATGNLALATGADFVLDHVDKRVLFIRVGSTWQEIVRIFGSQVAAQRAYLGLAIGVNVQGYDVDTVKSNVQTTFTRQQNFSEVALSYGAAIAWNLQTSQNARVTLTGTTAELSNPTNAVQGGTYILRVIQDGTGGRALTFAANYDFGAAGAPDPSTMSGGQIMILTFYYDGTKMRGIQSTVFG